MEPCIATTRHYDHKAARAKMTDKENHEILLVAYNQYRQAVKGDPINCAGVGCERKRRLIHIYRCFFCGRYFCPVCSKEHFGERFINKNNSHAMTRTPTD